MLLCLHEIGTLFAKQCIQIIYHPFLELFFTKTNATYCMGKQKAEAVASKNATNPLDYTAVRKAALVLRALNHKLRQRIMDVLHENKSLTVTQIYVQLRIEQSVASQHLAILRSSGAVVTERQGKFIIYSLDYDRLKEIQEHCAALDSDKG